MFSFFSAVSSHMALKIAKYAIQNTKFDADFESVKKMQNSPKRS
jgi:hypothetical protein